MFLSFLGQGEHLILDVFSWYPEQSSHFNFYTQALEDAAKLSKAATKLRTFSFNYGGSSPGKSKSATTPKTTPTHAAPSTPTATPASDPKGESVHYSSEHDHAAQWVDHTEADGTSGHAQHEYEDYCGHPGGTDAYYHEHYDHELYDTYDEQSFHSDYDAGGDIYQQYEQHGHAHAAFWQTAKYSHPVSIDLLCSRAHPIVLDDADASFDQEVAVTDT